MPGRILLRVRWTSEVPGSGRQSAAALRKYGEPTDVRTEFGLQCGRDRLVPGTGAAAGVIFETEVEPYIDRAGRQRLRGECVQGTPVEPFLYLSWRVAGHSDWIMRAKVGLASLTTDYLASLPGDAVLETDVASMGHRPASHGEKWRLVGEAAS